MSITIDGTEYDGIDEEDLQLLIERDFPLAPYARKLLEHADDASPPQPTSNTDVVTAD